MLICKQIKQRLVGREIKQVVDKNKLESYKRSDGELVCRATLEFYLFAACGSNAPLDITSHGPLVTGNIPRTKKLLCYLRDTLIERAS